MLDIRDKSDLRIHVGEGDGTVTAIAVSTMAFKIHDDVSLTGPPGAFIPLERKQN